MKFYPLPLNTGKKRSYPTGDSLFLPAVQDFNLRTTWNGQRLTLYIDSVGDGTGTAGTFDTVFMRVRNATTFQINTIDPISITDTVNDVAGKAIRIVDADGFHNVLYKHERSLTRTSVNITFNSQAEVSQLWILNEDDTIQIPEDKRFTQLDFDEVDRGVTIHEDWKGGLHAAPPIGNAYEKNNVTATCRFRPSHQSYGYLKKFFRDNRVGFIVAVDYPALPDMVHPYIADPQRYLRYISTYKHAGKDYTFTLRQK